MFILTMNISKSNLYRRCKSDVSLVLLINSRYSLRSAARFRFDTTLLHKVDHGLHSFCVNYPSLTTAPGSRLYNPIVRALDFCPGGPGFESRQGRVIFSHALFLFVTAFMS